jgi:phage tail-like protein
MSRGATDELPRPPVSLSDGVPAAFRTGPLVADLLDSFDAVLAPMVSTLDNLDAYFDPRYAPDDCLSWQATWISLSVDRRWPVDRIRDHLGDLRVALLNRGTLRGVRAALRACTGRDPVVADTGAVAWSGRPGGQLPGRQGPARLHVQVAVDESDEAMRSLVQAVVDDMKPAHVLATITWLGA